MAFEKLKTDYKDDQPVGEREYEITQNDNGTVGIKDVTTYAQVGDSYGGSDINATNAAVNGLNERLEETNLLMDRDFILLNKGALTFNSGNICSISDSRITADSLADVYFTDATTAIAEKAVITVETYNGRVDLVAGRAPEGQIVASIRIRVVG